MRIEHSRPRALEDLEVVARDASLDARIRLAAPQSEAPTGRRRRPALPREAA